MAKKLKVGDKVAWNSSGGRSVGKVEKKLTKTTKIKGFTVKPAPQNPEYLVRSAKSGKAAAHQSGALKKVTSRTSTPRRSGK